LDKELKKQIREDELKSGLEHAAGWLTTHRDEARITAIVAVVVAVAVGAAFYLRSSRRGEAVEAFGQALETWNARVASGDAAAAEPGRKTFATAQEKYAQAVTAFDALARRFPSSPEGARARYFAALARIELGQTAEAEKELRDLASKREAEALEPALARVALAELHRRAGDTDKAVEAYRQLAADGALGLPRDHALMALAATLEDAQKLAEARASYKRLVDEFPSSVYASEARRRADRLESAVEG
jgi:tetratricopeptide (TPR) repeat protein